jgi:hypothetical protein
LKFVPRDELFVTGSADKVISICMGLSNCKKYCGQ